MIVQSVRTMSLDQAHEAPALARLVAAAEVGGAPPDDEIPLYAPRRKIYPQSVHGTFRTIKWAAVVVTLGIYYLLPFVAYAWVGILTFTTYTLAGHMREQVCLYMCPWPRIQAALTDEFALNVTYRYDRGEPRCSAKKAEQLRAQGPVSYT